MSRRIAYVSSRFPVLREAFVIREVLALERAGVDVRVFSIKRPHLHLVNRDFESLSGTVYWTPHLLHWPLLRDNLATFVRAPLAYLGIPLRNAFRFRSYPLQALKTLGLFPKMVHYSREIQRQGCAGINACWANFPALLATIARRFFDIPFCMTCRAWDIFVPMNQVDLPEKLAVATVVRANNDAGARYVKKFCPTVDDEAKIRRVYNPFDVAAYRTSPSINTEELATSCGATESSRGMSNRQMMSASSSVSSTGGLPARAMNVDSLWNGPLFPSAIPWTSTHNRSPPLATR